MSLTLFYHPLASFCHKVLIALYEQGTPFTGRIVDLADRNASAEFFSLWPVGKIPLLRDERRARTIPETTVIIEYLDRYYRNGNAVGLFPENEDECLDARLWDRFFDSYVQVPMQKIVTDRLRPEGERDARGIADAVELLRTAYDTAERQLSGKEWAIGERFSVADCAAAPALFYSGIVVPFSTTHPSLNAYFERLIARPSFRRVLDEARPCFQFFPYREAIPPRFLQPSSG